MITLHPDQVQFKSDIYNAWDSGHNNVLGVAVTGFGKSIVVSDIANDKNQLGATQAILAHRSELIGQMSLHVANRGIKHRVIAPTQVVAQIVAEHRREYGRSFVNPDANCSVTSVQTLLARKEQLTKWAEQVDDWTIDEAHHVLRENLWGRAVAMFPNAKGLGVTASPSRADGQGLGAHHDGVFHAMVQGPDMRTLIDMGRLCDYELVCPASDLEVDDADFNKDGELSPAKGRAASKKSHIVGDVVQQYVMRAYGKRGIVFVTDVETASEVADNFNAVGIPAAAVSAKTPSATRNEYIRRFRDGRLWVLVNVDLFGEGFDVPAVEVVIMARPTGSLAVYLQQFGRALRLLAGKPFGLVIDMVSNYKRHGFPDKPHFWTLDRRDKRAKSEPDPSMIGLTACKNCSKPFEKFRLACPYCGKEVAAIVSPGGVRTLEQVDGDLVLLDRATLAEMRAAVMLETPAGVAERVAFAAGKHAGARAADKAIERWGAQQRLKDALAQWAGIERAAGFQDREIHKKFYLTTNIDVLSALALGRQDMETLAERIEGWYK